MRSHGLDPRTRTWTSFRSAARRAVSLSVDLVDELLGDVTDLGVARGGGTHQESERSVLIHAVSLHHDPDGLTDHLARAQRLVQALPLVGVVQSDRGMVGEQVRNRLGL